jgi:hypothetical protein
MILKLSPSRWPKLAPKASSLASHTVSNGISHLEAFRIRAFSKACLRKLKAKKATTIKFEISIILQEVIQRFGNFR